MKPVCPVSPKQAIILRGLAENIRGAHRKYVMGPVDEWHIILALCRYGYYVERITTGSDESTTKIRDCDGIMKGACSAKTSPKATAGAVIGFLRGDHQ